MKTLTISPAEASALRHSWPAEDRVDDDAAAEHGDEVARQLQARMDVMQHDGRVLTLPDEAWLDNIDCPVGDMVDRLENIDWRDLLVDASGPSRQQLQAVAAAGVRLAGRIREAYAGS